VLYTAELERTLQVCPNEHHLRIRARERMDALLDAEGRYEIGQEVIPVDPLKFKDSKKYTDRLQDAMLETGETDALIVVGGSIRALPVVVAIFEFEFMGGSMGSVVGERFCAAACRRRSNRRCRSFASLLPAARACRRVCCRYCNGQDHGDDRQARRGQVAVHFVLTDPTMGGVSASFRVHGRRS